MGLEARSLSPDLGAARAVRVILETITLENPDRDGLLDTPERVTRFIREATAGYRQDPEDVLTTFENATVSRNIRSGAPLSLNEYAYTTVRSTAIGWTIRS